jgi:hypothetical protein
VNHSPTVTNKKEVNNMETKTETKKELEAALKACVDLLEDIRQGLNSPVDIQIENLYRWHPLIKRATEEE